MQSDSFLLTQIQYHSHIQYSLLLSPGIWVPVGLDVGLLCDSDLAARMGHIDLVVPAFYHEVVTPTVVD